MARYHAKSTGPENEAHEKGTGKEEYTHQATPLLLGAFTGWSISTPIEILLQSVFLLHLIFTGHSLLAPKSVSSVCLILVYIEAPRVFRGLKIESFSSRASLRFVENVVMLQTHRKVLWCTNSVGMVLVVELLLAKLNDYFMIFGRQYN